RTSSDMACVPYSTERRGNIDAVTRFIAFTRHCRCIPTVVLRLSILNFKIQGFLLFLQMFIGQPAKGAKINEW
ncbi:hypothetical protein L9F63_003383, partial [Diploptera punctata]